MTADKPLAKRHSDYVQVAKLQTPASDGVPSLHTFAAEELRETLEPEPDGYARITKEQAEELLRAIADYAGRFGRVIDHDELLVAQLRDLLTDWE